METRDLRYFVAVAEEMHYGRAARRLGIAQSALSRTVQKIERRLGTALFARAGRTVALTEAGTVLLHEGRNALEAVEAAERRTRRAGRTGAERPGIVLATKAGMSSELLTKLLDAYAAEPDAATVEVVLSQCGAGEAEQMLRNGRADIALLHGPFDSPDGLDYEYLATEGQMVVLPAGHPLADRTSLTTGDLPALPQPSWSDADGAHPDDSGPTARDATQLLQLISLGRAYAILPETSRPYLTGGVAAVSLADAPSIETYLAWPSHSRSLTVAALVGVAARL